MIKLALCGAHGTGKTTILNDLSEIFTTIPILQRSVRSFWEDCGVEDFEKLPSDIRAQFQKHQLLNQLRREDIEGQNGFLTDRSVVDYWGYTVLSSNMSDPDLGLYKELIRSRLLQYSHVVFVPVMFEVKNERLRANIETRKEVEQIMKSLIQETLQNNYLLIDSKDHKLRIKKIQNYINGK